MSLSGRETYLHSTLAFCDRCNGTELARLTAGGDGVYLERMCPVHGTERVRIAADAAWYAARTASPRRSHEIRGRLPSKRGCPFDCGPCEWHTGGLRLPVFSITNDCNLNCPICFTHNRPDRKYYKTPDETRRIIGHIIDRSGGIQLINLTGGEPTLHPDLFGVLDACRSEGIGRITMNTNGIRIAEDEGFAEQIKASGVQLVLSLHTLDPSTSTVIHGKDITSEKKRCLERLEELNIPTTILPVCIKGVNETEVRHLVHTYIRKPFVRSATIQNMTFTGNNGSCFEPRHHITIDEIEQLLSGSADITAEDFIPLASYHPLCYSAAYYIVQHGRLVSLANILGREHLSAMTGDSYLPLPADGSATALRDGINRMWAEGADETALRIVKDFLAAVHPPDRRPSRAEQARVLEDRVKMVLIHAHMDRDNFDIDRASSCGDLVPDESGRMIPACSYNLLYRQQDPRFWAERI